MIPCERGCGALRAEGESCNGHGDGCGEWVIHGACPPGLPSDASSQSERSRAIRIFRSE
jgi:hypothetical protein